MWFNFTLGTNLYFPLFYFHYHILPRSQCVASIAQLVEHCTGIAEVTGSNPVEALNFFQASLFQLLKLEIHCDDHLSHSYYHTAEQRKIPNCIKNKTEPQHIHTVNR